MNNGTVLVPFYINLYLIRNMCKKNKMKPENDGNQLKGKREKWSVSICGIIKALSCLILADVILSVCLFYAKRDMSPVSDFIALSLVSLILLLLFTQRGFIVEIRRIIWKEEDCQFLTKEECPYGDIKDCPYNTNHCCAYKKEHKGRWKLNVLVLVFVLSLVVYVSSFFIPVLKDTDWVDGILRSVCLSVIVAAVMAFLVDIPGKMKEYQSYFVDLLSSNEYLKRLDESELMKLREKITWILHVKDIPNMPKGLIKLDNELCNMLRAPFFKEYSQHNDVKKVGDYFVKSIKTQYRAFNPYSKSHPVSMDIGLGIEMLVPDKDIFGDDEKLTQFVRDSIEIKKFSIQKDGAPEEDLRISSRVVFKRREEIESKDGTVNGQERVLVHIVGIAPYKNQPSHAPSGVNQQNQQLKNDVQLDQTITDTRFDVEFNDKILVELDYVIRVTDKDALFTKKLRYPVKYLFFEYAIDQQMDYTLDGQIIGTMIDPSDKLIDVSADKKRITMRTNSWLLPRNGVVVVINKNEI